MMTEINDKLKGNSSIDRREFLKIGTLGIGSLTLGSWLTGKAALPHGNRRAKSVIFVWLQGGPAHTDTFDPKTKAGKDYYGPYRKSISTNVPGIEIGQKLPMLAKIADKYSIIRSMTHGHFGHETATYVMQTGTLPGGQLVYPAFGAIVAYKKEAEYKGSLPPFISLTTPMSRFNEAGFLPPRYKSFATGGSPEKPNFNVEGIVNQKLSEVHHLDRRELLESLDKLSHEMETNAEVQKMDAFQQNAYSLILGKSKEAFEIDKEDEKTRNRYGMTHLGQSCLLARRLAEAGVPFITVQSTGWDTHKQHFEKMDKKLPDLDQSVSALIEDLSQRGMLDETIVLCGGEFGRTPRILWEAPWNGGRGHFGTAFSYLVAGGGFEGGEVVGSTNQRGEIITDRPVYPWDLTASIYQLLGINPRGTLPNPRDEFAYVVPNQKENLSGGILNEIMRNI
jgi:uncharacterized protein (DUF1501 family)